MIKKYQESETVELKEQYSDTLRKEIIAFANTVGGTIYVGVDDEGEVVGLDDPDFVIQQLSNSLRDAIRPDISMFVHYDSLVYDDKQILKISVQRGTNRPYYLAGKGLRPAGVYVRQGTSSVPASEAGIRAMIKETDGELFENMRSLNQDLTFEYASKVFNERKVKFGYMPMCSLKLIVDDVVYTNLALLLSDQCPHIIKAAVFNGTNQENFQDRCEFEGSLLKQLDDAYAFLLRYNKLHASFKGLLRVDTPDYPEIALREGLLNAIVHRDYSMLAPTLISVYADRVEMASFGGIVNNIELKNLLDGLSVCRNPQLANIFYRLRLIEAYGTGLQRIVRAYEGSGKRVQFIPGSSSFRVILENYNYNLSAPATSSKDMQQSSLSPKELQVLELLQSNSSINRLDVEKNLQVSQATASRILSRLVMLGVISIAGAGKNRRYSLLKNK